jgi:hypothetical protein
MSRLVELTGYQPAPAGREHAHSRRRCYAAVAFAQYGWSIFRRFLIPAVFFLTLVLSATAVLPAAAETHKGVGRHRLIVSVKKTMVPAAEKSLAVLVLINQDGGPYSGALARPSRPRTFLEQNSGLYRVKTEIEPPCKGICAARPYRISGAANHKLEVIPSCRPRGSGFVCSKVKVVKIY